MRFAPALLSVLLSVVAVPAYAASASNSSPPSSASGYSTGNTTPGYQPDLLSLSYGFYDFDKSESHTQASDFRVEYRFGYTLIGGKEIGLHPFLGYETTDLALQYGLGGLDLDWNFCHHGIATWSEGVGYLDSGAQRSMGGTLQFRSQIEAGYRFDNDMRVTAAFSHISDAKLTRINPGAEILGVYYHVPVRTIMGAVGF